MRVCMQAASNDFISSDNSYSKYGCGYDRREPRLKSDNGCYGSGSSYANYAAKLKPQPTLGELSRRQTLKSAGLHHDPPCLPRRGAERKKIAHKSSSEWERPRNCVQLTHRQQKEHDHQAVATSADPQKSFTAFAGSRRACEVGPGPCPSTTHKSNDSTHWLV